MRKIESSGNTACATSVQLARRGQIAAKRLFDNHARVLGQVRGSQSFNHGFEERRAELPDSAQDAVPSPAPL